MADVDQDTQSIQNVGLHSMIEGQASHSNADLAKSYTSGNSEARGLLNDKGDYNQGLSYGDRATSAAIRGKYMQQYGQQEQKLNNKMLQNADQDHVRQLAGASQMAGEEVELNKQKEILRYKKAQASRHARGQVLGQVLGIAGAVVGGVVAGVGTFGVGAAGGAMAGYAAGNAAGNAIGESN